MSTLADLFSTQKEIMENMNKLFINFKKEGKERRSSESTKRRIQSLDTLWKEFASNHSTLLVKCDEAEDNPYLSEDSYTKTQRFYEDVRAYLLNSLEETRSPLPKQPPPTPSHSISVPEPSPAAAGFLSSETDCKKVLPSPRFALHDVDKSNKLEEMMRKQQSNFKAFARTVSQININVMTERWELQDVLQSIESRWAAIDTLHWEIDSHLEVEDTKYDDLFTKYEHEYNEIRKTLNSKMWDAKYKETCTPQIDIPNFNGNYQQWNSFKDLFYETIHKNRSMSQAQKMQILKGKLRGEAERLVQHLNISSDNYQTCWDILNQRFNNKKLLFNSHMNVLMSLPTMHHQTASNIKKIHDTINECLNAIKNLGVDVSTWDPMIVFLMSQKLDSETYGDYIKSLPEPRDLPYLQDFLNYLEGKFIALETARRKVETNRISPLSHNQQFHHTSSNHYRLPREKLNSTCNEKPFVNHSFTQMTRKKCVFCSEFHPLYQCYKFRRLNNSDKIKVIGQYSICENCLTDHSGLECISQKRCRFCNDNHHSLLHDAYATTIADTDQNLTDQPQQSRTVSHVSAEQQSMTDILLATAQVRILGSDGTYKIMRALIDQGSQTSIISENAAQQLGVPRKRCKGSIFGIGAKESNCKGVVNITIGSLYNDFSTNIDAFIMKTLIKKLPNQSFTKPSWPYLANIQLADPEFNQSRPVDLLLGADVYSQIMQHGIIKEDASQPIAQQTQFGWILCGNVKSYYCNVILNNYDEIKKFWEIEDLTDGQDNPTNEDLHCLQQYQLETKRQADGRYIVRLPMKPEADEKLGESKPKAIAQFYQLERKFGKNNQIANDYKTFIREYINLGHMEINSNSNTVECFLPHHCVLRSESTTSAIRVVFNGSAKTSTGQSVNDLMYSGPNLQHDLLSIIVKWRQYKIGYVADVEKMYRQILVSKNDQRYQKIIWRDNPNEPLREYQLTTVTYGTKAAPFLALMTMKQLAKDEAHNYPEAAIALENNLYMDDLLHGQHNLNDAKKMKVQLIELFKSGGFHLRKWKSNRQELMENWSQDSSNSFEFKQQESTKTLGLKWEPSRDQFSFDIKISSSQITQITKRELLSEISKIFDPLGWISPVTTKLKLLFQCIWKLKLNWDDVLPENITCEWNKSKLDLQNINQVKIPRWLNCSKGETLELHGFCDASTKAYACVIFGKTCDSVVILAAKSRLVPLTKDVSLPRLELCAAHLMSKLMKTVQSCITEYNIKIYGWSDSTAVLGWINGDPNRWKQFVANRVIQITQIIPPEHWNYVKSDENPADCASRGITAAQLINHSIWWNGPNWLSRFEDEQSTEKQKYFTQEETKKQYHINAITKPYNNELLCNLIANNSNYSRTCRILAWVLRAFSREQKKPLYLTSSELKRASNKLVIYVQHTEFFDEINKLKNQSKLHSKSRLLPLHPFLDSENILRVGGRIRHANLNYEMKHPVILPNNNHLTDMIIDSTHQMTFHGGPRLTLAWLRRKFWIIGGNNAVKKRLRTCVICRRAKFENQNQLMGDLPAARTNQTRPFYHTGVDFTGYVEVKSNKGRGIKCSKGYIAVFVCLATKAVHLELVSDLTSSTFIAALRRMAARRGMPKHIYSDNGTNFVGANSIIQKEYFDLTQSFDITFYQNLTDMQIEWHFNAPSWPNAGGIWEAAVKSLKYHLRRVLGNQKLTYEEFSTLLTQLEGCLNSRPLCAISEDPEDLDFLTPSHFLASGPLLTIIETEKDERTRWQLIQKIYQDIWKRWQAEYLTQLNTRSKWNHTQNNIKINDVVIIQDVHISPGRWALGRVLEIHPGSDGLVRVVTLKTKSGILKRPINKLSILPVSQAESQLNVPTNSNLTLTKEQEKCDQRSHRRVKPPKSCYLITMAVMFLMMLISPSQGINHHVQQLRNSQTIFFDKINNMRLIRDDWKLVVFYDMNAYWEGASLAKKYIGHLETVCQKIQSTSHCQLVLLHLQHCQNELDHYNKILTNHGQLPVSYHRRRRGLINAVGSIAHSLFGVLDDEFALQYQKELKNLKSNQKYLNQLFQNQTSIIESEFNIINRMEKTIHQQHKSFNQHLNRLENLTSSIQKHVQENIYSNEFALASITANGILENLKDIQKMLLNTVTDIFHGKVNIHLLQPEQLIKELQIISNQISKELSLPIDNVHTELRKIYHLLTVKTRFTKENLIFEIKLPLVSRDTFEIYQLIPIPLQTGNKMKIVMPISELLAINVQRDLQIPFSKVQLQQCIPFDSDVWFCAHQIPISVKNIDQNYCVTENEAQNCKTERIKCKTTWTQLHHINNYMFSCCGQCPIQIICDYHITVETLTQVGILAVADGCVIKSEGITLLSRKQSTSDIRVKPDIFHIEIPTINNLINITLPIPTDEIDTHEIDLKREMKAIGEKIELVKNKSRQYDETSMNYHDVHHYVAIYILLSGSIMVCLAYGLRKIRARMQQRAEVVPTSQVWTRRNLQHQCRSEANQSERVSESELVHVPSVSASVPNSVSASAQNKNKPANKSKTFNFSLVE